MNVMAHIVLGLLESEGQSTYFWILIQQFEIRIVNLVDQVDGN